MAKYILRIVFDPEDVAAYQRDLLAIFLIYGACEAADVQPHLRAAFEEDVKRAGRTLGACMRQE